MTTKQDYIDSILQTLAEIALNEPHPELFAEIDLVLAKFNCGKSGTIENPADTIEILTAFSK